MRAERIARSEDVVSYVVRKGFEDIAEENFWYFAALVLSFWLCPLVLSETLWRVSAPTLVLVFVLAIGRTSVCENVTLVRGMGVQFERTNSLVSTRKIFVEEDKISAVVINEAVTTVDVYYYLCFVIEREADLMVGFPTSKPGIDFLVQVYREAKTFFPQKYPKQ